MLKRVSDDVCIFVADSDSFTKPFHKNNYILNEKSKTEIDILK